MGEDEAKRCRNQIHATASREPEATLVCRCEAGFIHMHDCPVTMGLTCIHYQPLEGEPDPVSAVEAEALHEQLMSDYMSRTYVHRVRSLGPERDGWVSLRAEIAARYDDAEEAREEPVESEADIEAYEVERDRLIARRKEREEVRREREERSREERAKERARMGIKTVVEKARDSVATHGNVASSVVDDVDLPAPTRKKRRRRRRGPRSGAEQGPRPERGSGPGGGAGASSDAAAGAPAPEGSGKRRRRRR
ncbi:MAG: hypothetical protein OER88_05955, partial [Planctomycetota bacterium]|nr:hypothetical protein [Planctomycetota bacterium]